MALKAGEIANEKISWETLLACTNVLLWVDTNAKPELISKEMYEMLVGSSNDYYTIVIKAARLKQWQSLKKNNLYTEQAQHY